MKKLLKLHGLNSDMSYYSLIAETWLNGNHEQAQDFFKAMPKVERVKFIQFAITVWKSGLSNEVLSTFIPFI